MAEAERKTSLTTGEDEYSFPNVGITANRPKKKIQQDIPGVTSNILNTYRSYTYNFTLAALTKEQTDDYKQGTESKFIILKSSGKGSEGFPAAAAKGVFVGYETSPKIDNDGSPMGYTDVELGKKLVSEFNQQSSGRFNMYINNVEIETIASFNPVTHVTPASGLRFDVFEPFSINGFFEALNAGAIACGWKSYAEAAFLFRISFLGYPDKEQISEPEVVSNSTRDFVIRFSKIELDVSERGTRYICRAVMHHEVSLGKSNQLKSSIKTEGKQKVSDILTDLINKLNEQNVKTLKSALPQNTDAKLTDSYAIEYRNEKFEVVTSNKFSESNVNELLKTEKVYAFADYGANEVTQDGRKQINDDPKVVKAAAKQDKGKVALVPGKIAIAFKRGSNIHECIAAIIRDSDYTSKLLKDIENDPKVINSEGMIDYFTILVYATSKGYSDYEKREVFNYTYVVMPFKVHFTQVPLLQNTKWSKEKITDLICRSYFYLYYGGNNDLLSFKFDYNHLYFTNVTKAAGNNFYLDAAGALVYRESDPRDPALKATNPEDQTKDKNPPIPLYAGSNKSEYPTSDTAGPLDMDGWAVLARNMYDNLINGYRTNLGSTIEIFGDPGFLINTAPGKNFPELEQNSKVLLRDGQINALGQPIFIDITFRNPSDIDDSGFYKFPNYEVPFSGVYQIVTMRHTFADGIFKQRFDINRLPGQISKERGKIESKPNDGMGSKPDPKSASVPNETAVVSQISGIRPQGRNVLQQIRNIASGVSAVPAALTAAITAPISDALSRVNQAADQVSSNISGVTAKITSAVQGINYDVAQAGEKLGIPINQLAGAGSLALAGLLKLAKNVPDGVNLAQAEKLGVNLNFPLSKLENLPPSQPEKVAPQAEQNTEDLKNLLQIGGAAALALSFGVKNLSKVSGSVLQPTQAASLVRSSVNQRLTNPLSGINSRFSSQDARKISDQTLANLNTVSPSVEVNLRIANANVGNTLDRSVTSQLGSKLSSPLTKYIDSINT